ncbi:subunit of heterodimeric actin capping protein cap32/34 [Pelomyxa schiedti]|nr:subunit of heterodimeric actin capping protein cap32/34 [Pelomyxa schiedti]
MTEQFDCALDLMRRLPPSQVEDNLAGLLDMVPALMEDLLSAVDQPLKISHDAASKRDYLLCDYNRDGDSYRSPWSNKYDPPMDGGSTPSAPIRAIEVQANEVFDIYRDLYYEGGVSSVYCWDVDGGFASCILIKKSQDQSKKGQPMKGTWDSIHVVEVTDNRRNAHYKLTSTVMLTIETETEATGMVRLAGSLTRQEEKDAAVSEQNPHITNIGRMVEDMELKLRTTIDLIYFGKTKEVVSTLRTMISTTELNNRRNLSRDISTQLHKS